MKITKYNTELNDDIHPILVKEMETDYPVKEYRTPDKIVKMLEDVFRLHKQAEEHLYLICMASSSRITGVLEVSHGSVNASIAGTREIFLKALLCGAANIILVHNHPSGNSNPSPEDINVAKRIKEASQLMGIPLVDNIVMGNGSYCSFCERGML